ncbi:MAG: filamentous hemagglutinin N-terminal domain-containing protein, partial [Candidatus Omnitrophica bacterium]|nr:filamentous hemagglutinin N-terminal domain-containing protein [Candidatus Omnitrophota bacterium]
MVILRKFLCISLCLSLCFSTTDLVYGLPQDAQVVQGAATITVDGNTMTVNAAADTIINYGSFNVAQNESVIFNLPTSSDAILNRVTGPAGSNLYGTIECNGVFMLVNPYGITVGPQATIQAQGVVLSTRDITNIDFMNHEYVFKKLDEERFGGMITNKGRIVLHDGGFGVLIAGSIKNEGVIIAPLGTIALAGGEMVRLDIAGGGLIAVAIEKAQAEKILDADGNPITEQISSTGGLEAAGGTVILDAESIPDIFEKAINLEGYVRAERVDTSGGVLRLMGSGTAEVDADIDVHDVSIGEGLTVEAGASHITLDGDWMNEGVFHGGSSEVEFIGRDASVIYGDNDFYDFTCVTPLKELYFEAGKVQAVRGAWHIEGAYAEGVKTLSTEAGKYWYLDPTGTTVMKYAWVEDGYNMSPIEMHMDLSTNRGGCYNWDAVVTWTNGSGIDSKWSRGTNWNNGMGVGTGDDAVFDGTSNTDSYVDSGFGGSVGSVSINAGYTSTIYLQKDLLITPSGGRSGSFTQANANSAFNCGSYNLTVFGAFTLSGGTFTAPGTGKTLTLKAGNINFTGGSFVNNSGTVEIRATGQTLTTAESGTATFYNLTFENATSDGKINLADSFTVDHTLTIQNSTAEDYIIRSSDDGNRTITVNGDMTFAASSGSGDITFRQLPQDGTGSLNVNLKGNFSMNNSNAQNYANMNFINTTADQTIDMTAGFVAVGTWTIAKGTKTATFTSDITLNSAGANGGGNLTLTNGVLDCGSISSLTMEGIFKQDGGTFYGRSAALTFNTSPADMLESGMDLNAGTFNSTSGTLTLNGVNADFTGGTFVHNNGTVKIMAGNSKTLTTAEASGTTTFYDLTIDNHDSGSGNLYLADSFTVGHDLKILNTGSATNYIVSSEGGSPNRTITVKGDMTFSPTSGTTYLDSSSRYITVDLKGDYLMDSALAYNYANMKFSSTTDDQTMTQNAGTFDYGAW